MVCPYHQIQPVQLPQWLWTLEAWQPVAEEEEQETREREGQRVFWRTREIGEGEKEREKKSLWHKAENTGLMSTLVNLSSENFRSCAQPQSKWITIPIPKRAAVPPTCSVKFLGEIPTALYKFLQVKVPQIPLKNSKY